MSNETKRATVGTTAELVQALAAGFEASTIDVVVPDASAAIAAARAEGVAEGKKAAAPDMEAAMDLGAEKERTRIAAITKIAQPGFDKELKAAIDDGGSPEAFAMTMLTVAGERGITMGQIKAASPEAANVSADDDDGKPKASVIDRTAIFAARGPQVGAS